MTHSNAMYIYTHKRKRPTKNRITPYPTRPPLPHSCSHEPEEFNTSSPALAHATRNHFPPVSIDRHPKPYTDHGNSASAL